MHQVGPLHGQHLADHRAHGRAVEVHVPEAQPVKGLGGVPGQVPDGVPRRRVLGAVKDIGRVVLCIGPEPRSHALRRQQDALDGQARQDHQGLLPFSEPEIVHQEAVGLHGAELDRGFRVLRLGGRRLVLGGWCGLRCAAGGQGQGQDSGQQEQGPFYSFHGPLIPPLTGSSSVFPIIQQAASFGKAGMQPSGRRKAIPGLGDGFGVVVPMVGLEPTRCCHQRILSPSRLPIPSHRPV